MPTTRLLLGMPVERFLREYWQKKPLLVRGALAGFRDPITAEELAGLACEDGVESRIVREKGGATPWEVTWGPHPEASFHALPDHGWTLLVQEVNRHVPKVARLLDRFAFLPNVRIDDVMVSFAAPGGSVGAHVDSYDVFLVQGHGERRWRFHSRPTRDARFVSGLDLRILERFRADVDEVLGAGDMLYLPPGFAHHGVAQTPCLTYSIGFRAPTAGEIWASLTASLARREDASRLLVDPPLSARAHPGAIPPALLARVRKVVRSMDTSDDAIDRAFAAFATRIRPGHELAAPLRPPRESVVLERLARGDAVRRSEEGRFAFLPRSGGGLFLYVGGVELEVHPSAAPVARLVCAQRSWDGVELAEAARSRSARALIVDLFARGALRFVRASRR
jgi:50S ribosomal protein L16 3-hydroxylase